MGKVKRFRCISIEILVESKSMTVGDFLRRSRIRGGISIREMAKRCGKDNVLLGQYERGVVSPSLPALEQICPHYGVEVWEAVAGMKREELLGRFPDVAPPGLEPARQVADRLVAEHGLDSVLALLHIVESLPDPAQLGAAVRAYQVILSQLTKSGPDV
jgi:transcriptional regulator with XRE-family HTH domain